MSIVGKYFCKIITVKRKFTKVETEKSQMLLNLHKNRQAVRRQSSHVYLRLCYLNLLVINGEILASLLLV